MSCYVVGREDLTKQCQLDHASSNVTVHQPVVITADKNAAGADVKNTSKDDSDGMSYLDDEVCYYVFMCASGCHYSDVLVLTVVVFKLHKLSYISCS